MAQQISDKRDMDFVLYEQLCAEQVLKFKKFKDFNRNMFDMIVKEARSFAIKEILPTFTGGDREGVTFNAGSVTVPECFRRAHQLIVEGEWGALTEDPVYGGQGLPHVIAQAANEYLIGANYSLMDYGILGHGAGKMIELYGTENQKKLFLKNVYTCKWGATMLLTEPQAGSDLGALSTSAVKNSDGTYSITGNKIFITNGEQNLTENIIHPVLARIEGAPSGTKGISIFLVPKIWVNDDGSFGEKNDVICTGVEEKLGIHGSPTCSLSLGSKGKCRGFLLGEENKGMMIMFNMMNMVRLEVGTQAFSHASTAYLHALDYARGRLQGRSLGKNADHDTLQVPIIQHPDVRRMLLWMKAYTEGMRSLIFYTALCFDKAECSELPSKREYNENLAAILTPVVKAYCSERGFDVCVQAMQVFGGYGYTKEFPMEQLVRDCKITSLYEGTNGIQAMDLLGRKLSMKDGALFNALICEIKKTISLADTTIIDKQLSYRVRDALLQYEKIAEIIDKNVKSKDIKTAFAHAHPFLEVTGDIIMAWMLLWRASIATLKVDALLGGCDDRKLRNKKLANNKNAAFYDGIVKSAKFFINTIIPVTMGKMDAIAFQENAAVEIHEKSL